MALTPQSTWCGESGVRMHGDKRKSTTAERAESASQRKWHLSWVLKI